MRKRIPTYVVLLVIFVFMMMAVGPTLAATGDPVLINEVLASHSGTDDTEFIELYGTPGYSLNGLSLIVVEGDAFGPGAIDRRFDFKPFHQIGPNGFFLFGNCGGLPANYSTTPDASIFNNYLENSSLTVALVETASISGGSVTGSEVVRDVIALTDGDAGDTFYFGAPVIGPDGPFFPAGARRTADGVDTDTATDWTISSFNLPGDNTPTGGGFNGCAPISLTIPEIQGDGRRSIYEGEVVTTSGIVTLYSANGRDFWLQDPNGDGNQATSDALVVDDGGFLPGPPQIGDLIEITAVVEEQQFGTSLPLTRLDAPSAVTILSSGNALPAPVPLVDLPDLSIPEGELFWEALEGMRVSVENAPVSSATNGFGEFGMLAKDDAKPGSGFFADTQHILVRNLGEEEVDYNPERIMVDDISLAEAIMVQPGDRVRSLVGVVDYTFSMYKLQPEPGGYDIKTHNLPNLPASKRSGGFGNATITTFNVENLFDLIDNPDKEDEGSTPTPGELETQLAKLALAIEIELDLPEIIIVQETENTAILQELGDRVNAAGETNYVATSFETSDVRGIEVGFLWDSNRVTLLDAFQMSGPEVEAWFGPDSPSPGREPLVGLFDINGNQVTIIGNHFKSKGGDDPLYGVNWPPIRFTEVQRKGQAGAVRNFVNGILAADPGALVMVAGDLNDFQFSEPGEGPDHPVAILEGGPGQVPLTNLINLEKDSERFTFVFDGNAQVLDHILVSPALLEHFVAADVLHFNTTTPAELEADPTTPLSASDHDPLESRFKFTDKEPSQGNSAGKAPGKKDEKGGQFILTILHNNDGESQVIDAGADLEDFGGAARFKTVVDNLKWEAIHGPREEDQSGAKRGVIMLSSGDNFLAGPEFNASLVNGVPFYDTIAMQLIGYNAVSFGNHDFDFGPDVLADFLAGYTEPPPYVAANLDFSGEPGLQAYVDAGVIVPATIVKERGELIGVIGIDTPNLPFISSPRNVVVSGDLANIVQGQVNMLEAQGANKIILAGHLQNIENDKELVAQLDGVDVVIAGGGDELLANPGDLLIPGDEGEVFGTYPQMATDVDGTMVPVVTTSGEYRYVGKLVLGFDKAGNLLEIFDDSGPVRVATGDCNGSLPCDDAVEPDPTMQAMVVDPVAAAVEELGATVIGTSEVALDGTRSNVRSVETNEGNLIADALKWQAEQLAADFGVSPPDVALQNGGGIRNNTIIPAGDITELDTFDMVPFPNFVTVVPDIPRTQFKEILENAVACTQDADFDANPNCGSGRFAQISGFSFEWTASGTGLILDLDGNVIVPGTRVLEVALDDGTPIVTGGSVVPGPDLNIATIDFLARGGDQYPYRGAPFTAVGVSYQQALSNYIQDALGGVISATDYPEGGEGRITTP